jgi:hypothetical protein
MLEFDPQRCIRNVRDATTEDLMDRVTVYRNDLELEAIPIIEEELRDRGVSDEDITFYADSKTVLIAPEGYTIKCSFCYRPAIEMAWGWHKIFQFIPVFPRRYRWCQSHLPPVRKKNREHFDDDD